MKVLLLSIVLVGLVVAQDQCNGKPQNLPIYDAQPELVSTSTNGKLFTVKQATPAINLLHVYGSAYDMGFAHGSLMKDQVNGLISQFYSYIYEQIDQYLDELPEFLRQLFEQYGVEAVLEATYWMTESYIPQHFLDEMRGLADGSGIDYMTIVRIHMFPEVIKAQCSMMGAWGPAIANTQGSLYQLRALDWSTDGPFQQYPTVIVYHPTNGHNFSIVTFAGFIGAITGYSSAPMGICEKVWIHYNSTSSRSGIPWHFLLREILQFDADTDSALSRIASAARTCSIFVGLGDYTNTFKAVEYSYERVEVFDDHNFPTYPNHPNKPGVVYIDRGTQPTHNPCFGSLVEKFYGSLDPQTIIQNITPVEQTGDAHIAIYDFAENDMYVAYASPYNAANKTFVPAYNRPFVKLSMGDLFAVSK